MNWIAIVVTIGLTLDVAACADPTQDKPKATVSDPVVTASASSGAASVPALAMPPDASAPNGSGVDVFSNADSKIGFVAGRIGGTHEGSFDTFTGTFSLVENDPTKSSLTIDVQAASVEADEPWLRERLKSAAGEFPKVSFQSTAITKGGDKGASNTVTGNFQLHGVTKSITFPATISVSGGSVSMDSEFSINRRDFGMIYPSKPDALIKNDVLIKLTLRAAPSKG